MVKCLPINWNIGCLIHDHWVNCCSAAWVRAFTSTAPARSTIQASACRQLPSLKFTKKIVYLKLGCCNIFFICKSSRGVHAKLLSGPHMQPTGRMLCTAQAWSEIIRKKYCFFSLIRTNKDIIYSFLGFIKVLWCFSEHTTILLVT